MEKGTSVSLSEDTDAVSRGGWPLRIPTSLCLSRCLASLGGVFIPTPRRLWDIDSSFSGTAMDIECVGYWKVYSLVLWLNVRRLNSVSGTTKFGSGTMVTC